MLLLGQAVARQQPFCITIDPYFVLMLMLSIVIVAFPYLSRCYLATASLMLNRCHNDVYNRITVSTGALTT